MKLSETWFMEGYVDFELQKYRLLAYLQEVDQYFNETKLYPSLADLVIHFNNLIAFRENKKLLQNQFPKKIDVVNLQKLELIYEQILADDELMTELEIITNYGLEKMKSSIDNGAAIYEFIENKTKIEPIGIIPLYKNEGYLLLRYGQYAEVRGYAYTITLFEHKDARYKGVRINYVDTWKKSIVNTYENIKREIIKNIRTLPNPAVFSIETELSVPYDETLLPIAKRMLMKQLADVN